VSSVIMKKNILYDIMKKKCSLLFKKHKRERMNKKRIVTYSLIKVRLRNIPSQVRCVPLRAMWISESQVSKLVT
jgi:hypothetical protein